MSVQRNTAINIIGAALPMILMLVTVPLYLKLLGDVRYGVLSLVWLVLGYLSFMELGLGKATANQIARAQSAPPLARSEIFWTAMAVNGGLGLIAACVLWLTGDYLISHVIKMPDGFRNEALSALPWLVATFPLALISSVLNGALEGANKFLLLNSLQVFGNVLFQLAPLLIAYWLTPSLVYVIPAAVLSRVITNFALIYVCHVHVTNRAHCLLSLPRARSLLGYGGWIGLSSLVTPTLESIDRFVIGATIGAKSVTYYTIAYQLAAKLRILPASFSRALFPRLSIPTDDRNSVAAYALQVLARLMTPAVIIIILLLTPFLNIWIGPEAAANVNTITYLFLFGIWINSIGHVPVTLLIGSGNPRAVATIHVLEVAPFVTLIYFSAINFGVTGVAAAWLIRATVDTAAMCHFANMTHETIRVVMLPITLLLGASCLAYLGDQSIIQSLHATTGILVFLAISLFVARNELGAIAANLNKALVFKKISGKT